MPIFADESITLSLSIGSYFWGNRLNYKFFFHKFAFSN